jgi:hypothetical protein
VKDPCPCGQQEQHEQLKGLLAGRLAAHTVCMAHATIRAAEGWGHGSQATNEVLLAGLIMGMQQQPPVCSVGLHVTSSWSKHC